MSRLTMTPERWVETEGRTEEANSSSSLPLRRAILRTVSCSELCLNVASIDPPHNRSNGTSKILMRNESGHCCGFFWGAAPAQGGLALGLALGMFK